MPTNDLQGAFDRARAEPQARVRHYRQPDHLQGGRQAIYIGIYSGIGGWIGLPVTAGLDLNDKFGAIGATAMTKAAGLQHIPQGGELNVFRLFE